MYWENKDANKFCQQLGYEYGETSVQISLGKSMMPIWLSHVECNGDETDFMQCRSSWNTDKISQCTHFDDAGVKCFKSGEVIVRENIDLFALSLFCSVMVQNMPVIDRF